MINNRVKLFVIAAFVLPVAAAGIFDRGAALAVSIGDDDIVAIYKAKCLACHGPTALKNFDPAKPLAEHVAIILDGKKGAKPPFMPAYKDKGVTPEQATALAEYMLQLHPAPTPTP